MSETELFKKFYLVEKTSGNMFLAGIVLNQGLWFFNVWIAMRELKGSYAKQNELYDIIDVLMETADLNDERVQQWATDIEFDQMSRSSLKSLKPWWKR